MEQKLMQRKPHISNYQSVYTPLMQETLVWSSHMACRGSNISKGNLAFENKNNYKATSHSYIDYHINVNFNGRKGKFWNAGSFEMLQRKNRSFCNHKSMEPLLFEIAPFLRLCLAVSVSSPTDTLEEILWF